MRKKRKEGKVPDFDAIIIGGGPAWLTAGIYLSRGKCRTLLVDKDGFGGNIKNADWIENYPGFSGGVAGPQRPGSVPRGSALSQGFPLGFCSSDAYHSRAPGLFEPPNTAVPRTPVA